MALKCVAGGRDSDSFATLEEASAYIQIFFPVEYATWEGLETDAQELYMKLAALAIGYLPLRGRKIYCGQALSFPRSTQDDVYANPEEVKMAQSYLAFGVIYRAMTAAPAVEDGPLTTAQVTGVSLGGLLAVDFKDGQSVAGPVLERLMRNYTFPVYISMKKWTTQFRGGTVLDLEDEETTCSTTTTTSSTSSTTSTTVTATGTFTTTTTSTSSTTSTT